MGIVPNPGRGSRPLLLKDIEAAIANTNSNAEAARYLNVHLDTYRKYAAMYGVYEQHKNQGGKGVNRPKMKGAHGLESILRNEHPNYNRRVLKARLIAAGYIKEQCGLCGFNRKRDLDGRCPLVLCSLDGNNQNFTLDNLQLRCYNCSYLTTGHITIKPEVNTNTFDQDFLASGQVSIEDIKRMQNEIQQELSNLPLDDS